MGTNGYHHVVCCKTNADNSISTIGTLKKYKETHCNLVKSFPSLISRCDSLYKGFDQNRGINQNNSRGFVF